MVTTVTLNAAIDRTYEVDSFSTGQMHWPEQVRTVAGGKGINVARILRTLGQYVSTCLAFYAVPVAIAVLYVHAFAKTMRAYGALDNLSGFTELDPGAYVLFFAACFIVVYGVFLVGRILGGLGAANAERYEWE